MNLCILHCSWSADESTHCYYGTRGLEVGGKPIATMSDGRLWGLLITHKIYKWRVRTSRSFLESKANAWGEQQQRRQRAADKEKLD